MGGEKMSGKKGKGLIADVTGDTGNTFRHLLEEPISTINVVSEWHL